MGKFFGTDGIRGRAFEHPVTVEMARRLGRAVVEISGKGRIMVGRDTRESGPELEEGLVRGIREAGGTAVRLGVGPTPAVAYLVRNSDAKAGVMITASHNPYEDNGLKVFGGDGYKLKDEEEERVEENLEREPEDAVMGGAEVFHEEGMEDYAEAAKASLGGTRLDGMKVVLDAGNGAGWKIGPEIFRDLGAEVIGMAVEPDGRNINGGCGALHAEGAGRRVVEAGADLGISLDGDADRVIFTDATGSVVSGDRVLGMCAAGLKAAGRLPGDRMVVTVMSNLGLDEAMAGEGISVVRTGVGDRMVLERMREEGIAFGGENSGHLIFAEHATTGDGIVSALQVCRMMISAGKTLAGLADGMREFPSRLEAIRVEEKRPLEELEKLAAMMAEADRELGGDGRHLIRYSGTERKIRVLVEHRDEAVVEMWMDNFRNVIWEELG